MRMNGPGKRPLFDAFDRSPPTQLSPGLDRQASYFAKSPSTVKTRDGRPGRASSLEASRDAPIPSEVP